MSREKGDLREIEEGEGGGEVRGEGCVMKQCELDSARLR